MTEKIPCSKCGAMIRPSTAKRNHGLCMPCKSGNRENMERNKRRIKEQRERERNDPFRLLWKSLVDRVSNSPSGFESLSEPEKFYFAVGLLEGEVYNGGFDQYFWNSSSSYFTYAVQGLLAMGAQNSLVLLREAKSILFGTSPVPTETESRRKELPIYSDKQKIPALIKKLDELDNEFYKDQDNLGLLLQDFARKHGLV